MYKGLRELCASKKLTEIIGIHQSTATEIGYIQEQVRFLYVLLSFAFDLVFVLSMPTLVLKLECHEAVHMCACQASDHS